MIESIVRQAVGIALSLNTVRGSKHSQIDSLKEYYNKLIAAHSKLSKETFV